MQDNSSRFREANTRFDNIIQ
jgi:hypothetical protein